jgi:hypothetical protein
MNPRVSPVSMPPDFRVFLQRELVARCKFNPSYSLRAFAKQLALEPSYLSKVLARKKPVTPRLISRLAPRLGLSAPVVQQYLASQSQAGDYVDLSLDQFEMISDWYHYAILELVQTKGFRSSPDWIARRLGIKMSEARAAVARLVRLGLLEVTPQGRLRNSKPGNTTVGNPYSTVAFRHLQRQILSQAILAMDVTAIEERDQSSMTVAIDAGLVPEVKERIKKFRRQLAKLLQSSGSPMNEVYQLSVSFFPVSKPVVRMVATLAFVLGSLTMAPGARAQGSGGQEGHGGGGILCQATSTSAESVETYDLYEARRLFRFTPPATVPSTLSANLARVEERALRSGGTRFREELQASIRYVRNHLQFRRAIPVVHDGHWIIPDPGCRYVQLARWSDRSGRIEIDRALYLRLTSFEKTALLVHEAVYSLYRRWKQAKTSDEIREITGRLLLDTPLGDLTSVLGHSNHFIVNEVSELLGLNPSIFTASTPWLDAASVFYFHPPFQKTAFTVRSLFGNPRVEAAHLESDATLTADHPIRLEMNQVAGPLLFYFSSDEPFSVQIESSASSTFALYHLGRVKAVSTPTDEPGSKYVLRYWVYFRSY